MKTDKIILALLFGASTIYAQTDYLKTSIHQFVATDIDGNPFNFRNLKGKKVLVLIIKKINLSYLLMKTED